MSWTSSADLRGQLEKYWRRGDILRARLAGEALFPLTLRLHKPDARDITERFADVADWVRGLREDAKEKKGFGYTVHWRQQRHRVQGANDLPDVITVDSEDDALHWLGRHRDAARFSELADRTLVIFPTLRSWLCQYPLKVLEHQPIWDDLLAVLAWFQAHPRPGVYLRELDIPGIHTKFIEAHRGLLGKLLDAILPAETIDASATGVRGFNRRYGLRDKPALIRFRLLEDRLAISGLTDLTIPVDQFARLDPGVDTVFITENEINGLAFPSFPRALVIFGLGYGVDALRHLPWLASKRLYYWGDIDTHGFAILNRFRQPFPHAHSLLMDRNTLEAHRGVWGREADAKRFNGALDNLTEAETALYETLRENQLAPGLRLEQEHIAQRWLLDALSCL
ncbi:hypothetical protein DWB85_01335 [Seongchinamella sediminis]|uniref:Wadjet protein JetD C-terminal domain-containing protein n=1 Tax=Seongchinamella sediminis TaxID=2283635 RepID=A0A3L7E2P6_9GAMM|nr:DUF3322 domain-containing protein [Seongchinamella sediminis]RLQ23824.1 hypothetical protein DWB85_01335 [Seongchinamella sediminis]